MCVLCNFRGQDSFFRKKCGCADIYLNQMKHSSYLLKLKLIIHECFSQPSLCVLAYKFLELMVNQMVQRLFDPPTPCLLCFLVGGLLEQGSAVNKFISIRICIDTVVFLLLKIKHFGLKVFVFISLLRLQKKTVFWIALACAPQCSFPAENER